MTEHVEPPQVEAEMRRTQPLERLVLRTAGWRDLFAIYRAHCDCFPHPYPFWRILHYHLSTRSRILLLDLHGELVGYLIATCSTHLRPPRLTGEVISLAVLAAWRRRGLGERLLLAGMSWLTEVGMTDVFLQVAVSNDGAQALYQRHGFRVTDRLQRYYADGEDAFLMLRQSEPPAADEPAA